MLQYIKSQVNKLLFFSVENSSVLEWLARDVWGRRQQTDWGGAYLNNTYSPVPTTKGFTGHEHLDAVGLIHMNGRVYDPEVVRFVSADP